MWSCKIRPLASGFFHLRVMSLRSTHDVVQVTASFLFMAESYSIICLYPILVIHLSVRDFLPPLAPVIYAEHECTSTCLVLCFQFLHTKEWNCWVTKSFYVNFWRKG